MSLRRMSLPLGPLRNNPALPTILCFGIQRHIDKKEMAMDRNVLVLAMSTLPGWVLDTDSAKTTKYKFKENGVLQDPPYEGVGQLEVVPMFIQNRFKTTITHVIILATTETLGPITYRDKSRTLHDAHQTYAKIIKLYSGRLALNEEVPHELGADEGMSHIEFFERRLAHEGLRPTFEVIGIDPQDLEPGLEELQVRIRTLYRECTDTGGEWRLWLDVHGGFRDVSMAMFGLMQMLVAPDEQDFAKFMQGDTALSNAIKRMGDGRDTVPITAVYTIAYDQANKIQAILDKTDFYSNFTKPAIQAYMNYGQYAQMLLKPDTSGPYAFISYRRDDAKLERYAFLGSMKRFGYRFWYDDGIELQMDWEKALSDALASDKCVVLIAIVTKTYYKSEQCVKELDQAIREGKLVILVSPDKTPLYAADKDIEAGGIVIKKEVLEGVVRYQQFNMETHILDEVFQEPAVEARLAWLAEHDERFGSIRI